MYQLIIHLVLYVVQTTGPLVCTISQRSGSSPTSPAPFTVEHSEMHAGFHGREDASTAAPKNAGFAAQQEIGVSCTTEGVSPFSLMQAQGSARISH